MCKIERLKYFFCVGIYVRNKMQQFGPFNVDSWKEHFKERLEKGEKIPWIAFEIYMCIKQDWTRGLLRTAIKNNDEFREFLEPFVELEF